jgi:hypothetical protein
MKLYFYNVGINFLKLIIASLLVGYLYALYHVVYVDKTIPENSSFIDYMRYALGLLVWIILLLLSGVYPKVTLK